MRQKSIFPLQSLPPIAHNFVEIKDTYDLNRAEYLLCELEQCCTVLNFLLEHPTLQELGCMDECFRLMEMFLRMRGGLQDRVMTLRGEQRPLSFECYKPQ